MNEKKFDEMMKAYCDREVDSFELKERRNPMKYTSVLAAALVLAILATIVVVPRASSDNSFTLTVSAAQSEKEDVLHYVVSEEKLYSIKVSESESDETITTDVAYGKDDDIEYLALSPLFNVTGENIEKVRAYSDKGNIAIALCAKNYNATEISNYDNFSIDEGEPDPLVVTPYVKDSEGNYVEANPDTWQDRYLKSYSCVEIEDINRNPDEKYISISCYPIDKNCEFLMPENFSSDYSDKVTIEVTYLNGEVQKKYANITFEDSNMIVDVIK